MCIRDRVFVDSIVTDPPYELGFMGRSWDSTGIAFQKETWELCFEVLKPGGHLLAFSGSRTYHRMAVAIEDAGFEIRDQVMWLYGSGFPKSMNVGKALDKKLGNERESFGTKLKKAGDMRGGNYVKGGDYKSIDINGAYESFQFDLNKNISKTYNFNQKYDLVINNGTGEHVFNQHALFLNFHNLTKNGGIMLNILPFIDWVNHGFYNFNPIFFADLAASNNYKIEKISLANRDGAELKLNTSDYSIMFEQIKPHRNDSKFNKIIVIAKTKLF